MRNLQKRFEGWAGIEGLPLTKDEAGSYEDDRTAAAFKAHRLAAKGMYSRVIQELKIAISMTDNEQEALVLFFRNVEGLDK